MVDIPDTGPVIDTGPRPDGGGADTGAHDGGAHDANTSTIDANLPDTNVDAFVAPDAFVDVDGGSDAGPPPCGNGTVDTGETCDTAITTGAGACPTTCNDGVACTADAMTGSACTTACTHTPIAASGTTVDMCCPSGATHTTDVDCPASCGNGVVDSGETCDTMIASGTGSCPTAASCNDSMACTTDALVSGGTCNAMCTHTAITAPSGTTVDMCCPPAANHTTDTDCAPVCGNSVIEGPGETCDPPNAANFCDTNCHTIAGCGNGVLETGEDCDDHNTRNLDGCDSACHYESFSRLTELNISSMMAPTGCTPRTNQLGRVALTTTAVGQLNPILNTDVNDGSLSILIQALGLTDLTGANDPSFMMGVVSSAPTPAFGTMMNPADWGFVVDRTNVNAMGLPIALMAGSIVTTGTTHRLTGGPATINIPLALGGPTTNLTLTQTHVLGVIGNTATHPAYPASLRASVTTFTTITGSTDGTNGLCGNVTVSSLAQIPIPMALTSGAGNCSEGYTYCGMGSPVGAACNSLLDAIVNGCHVLGGLITVINATQPDVAGGSALIHLAAAGTHHKVAIPAGDADAYSSYFLFTANRAHAASESCTTASDCQTGLTCSATHVCM